MKIVESYYAALVPALTACLAVVASLALKGRTLPLSLILEGFSGYGKTAVLQMFFALALELFIYRSDKFSPKSFVSHAANVKRQDLAKIDLLPRLKDKTLVTKELAPLFRGRDDELTETFAQLCTVLDGKGLTTDSGMQGQRGYKKYIVFNWLGATTPVPPETHGLMYQLGTRLLFFEVASIQPTRAELFEYMQRDRSNEAEQESKKAVTFLLLEFFRHHPVSSVEPDSIVIPENFLMELACWAELLAAGRAKIIYERSNGTAIPIAANPPEAAFKISNYFMLLARGSALIQGRKQVEASDVDMVAHIAISSIPGYLRPIIRLFKKTARVDSTTAASVCGVSQPTSRKYLKELSLLGFGTLRKGDVKTNTPDTLTRAAAYSWLDGGP